VAAAELVNVKNVLHEPALYAGVTVAVAKVIRYP
jgi:hypothetical protein